MSKALAIAALVLATLYGLLLFTSANEISSSQSFLENRLELFMEIANEAAIIAVDKDSNESAIARKRLEEISAGPLVLVGDERVIWAMSLFNTCLAEPENDKCKDRDLRQLASGLAKAMRLSLTKPLSTVVASEPN